MSGGRRPAPHPPTVVGHPDGILGPFGQGGPLVPYPAREGVRKMRRWTDGPGWDLEIDGPGTNGPFDV
jgi:hypothetical protein